VHSQTWKQFERDAAAFIGGERYPANQGGPIDVESEMTIGQCKKKRCFSHAELAREVKAIQDLGFEKNKLGVVLHQTPRQKGTPPIPMITMSWATFDEYFCLRKTPENIDPKYAHKEASTGEWIDPEATTPFNFDLP